MNEIKSGSVNLVVTSPPYPIIKMWDDSFAAVEPALTDLIAEGRGDEAFEKMHLQLDPVWTELKRVMAEGAIACINIGDAVRSFNGSFKIYSNHVRIINKFNMLGFQLLPGIIWRKPTNSPNKFMGSGTLPAGAYVTLEHEHILIFRRGGKREFKTAEEKMNRRKSALFWEERNSWYSDLWQLKGTRQNKGPDNQNKGPDNPDKMEGRSAAFPLKLPFRLINMFSVYGDTVLDPFIGTGTTMFAALAAARNSVGYEINEANCTYLEERLKKEKMELSQYNLGRLNEHCKYVTENTLKGKIFKYTNSQYGFPVKSGQEKDLLLYGLENYVLEKPFIVKGLHSLLL